MKDAAILHHLTCLAVALLVAACGSQPPAPTTGPATTPILAPAPQAEAIARAGKYAAELTEVEQLLDRRQLIPAASILGDLVHLQLNPAEQAQASLLGIRLHYLKGDLNTALTAASMSLASLPELDAASRWQLQQWHIRLLLAENALESARYADQILAQTPVPEQRQQLIAHIWHTLQSSTQPTLRSALQLAQAQSWQGWLGLAIATAGVAESPEVQLAQLEFWLQSHENHPAAAAIPGGLDYLAAMVRRRPGAVALVLPLSGRLADAGDAVLEGYLAASFDAIQRGWEAPDTIILDIGEYSDINAAYDAAVARGAELVIGPLSRASLARWLPAQHKTVPLLALNRLEQQAATDTPRPGAPQPATPQPATPQPATPLYQLALAPEDEVRQLARMAFARGARQALLIRPAGSWGDAVAESFRQEWLQLQGSISATTVYTNRNDYSPGLKTALNLAESEDRAKRVRQFMDTRLEFSPRRRQDIDSIFLLTGKPGEARAIKPLLAFHYAGDLPVYATSHIYNGQVNRERDSDLNGINLLEIPWLLDPDNPLREVITVGEGRESLAAMHALGADAFLLHWRTQQLQASPRNSVRGQTGLLSMDAGGRIHRQLRPARMETGIPVAR